MCVRTQGFVGTALGLTFLAEDSSNVQGPTMILTRQRAAFAALTLSLAFTAPLSAQASPSQTATTQVSARVFTPLAITSNEALRFGNLFSPFTAKTIAWTDNAASGGRAHFTITGEGGAELALSIMVPTNISSGANSIPLSTVELRHGTTDADATGTVTTLNTGTANSLNVTMGGAAASSQSYFLRVRATATPAANQAAGSYTGTISVAVNYTGS
jgi:hypothetical protein